MKSKLDCLAEVAQREFYQNENTAGSDKLFASNGKDPRFFPLTVKNFEIQYLTTNPRFGVQISHSK